jgi:hypothetical protein
MFAVKSGNDSFDLKKSRGEKFEAPLVVAGGLILLAAAFYGAVDAMLTPPVPRPAGLIDVVLASRTVVAAIRVAVIFAAAFVVVSVVALTARRQWLVRVGPVEVSDQVVDLGLEKQRTEESLENAMQTIDSLRYELVLSDLLLDRAVSDLEKDG